MHLNCFYSESSQFVRYKTVLFVSGLMAGRPEKQIDIDQLQDLLDAGYTKKDIADQLGVCRNTLNKFLPPKQVISDEALDGEIIEAKTKLPEMGERLVIGFLRSKG